MAIRLLSFDQRYALFVVQQVVVHPDVLVAFALRHSPLLALDGLGLRQPLLRAGLRRRRSWLLVLPASWADS